MNKVTIRKTLVTLIIGLITTLSYASDTYAVIVAVEDYKVMTALDGDLKYTVDDAMKMTKFLMSKEGGSVPKENIYLLTNKKARKANIIYYTKQLFAKAKEGDKVIFYFSGHGTKGAFVPYDVTKSGRNLLYFAEVKSLFKVAKCKTKLLYADACFSGGLKEKSSKKLKKILTKNSNLKAISNQQIAVMLSSSKNETSIEMPRLKQGLFTYAIIKGLKGLADKNKDNIITIEELFKYVHYYTVTTAKKVNHSQTPVLFGNFNLNLKIADVIKN
jgi:uncharacterized caspase-like protein